MAETEAARGLDHVRWIEAARARLQVLPVDGTRAPEELAADVAAQLGLCH